MSSGVIGLLLIIPGWVMWFLLMFNIQPNFGPFKDLLSSPTEGPNVIGSLVALSLMGVLPIIAFFLNLAGFRKMHGGLFNKIVATLALVLVLGVIATIVVDQYPCWIGAPNCD